MKTSLLVICSFACASLSLHGQDNPPKSKPTAPTATAKVIDSPTAQNHPIPLAGPSKLSKVKLEGLNFGDMIDSLRDAILLQLAQLP